MKKRRRLWTLLGTAAAVTAASAGALYVYRRQRRPAPATTPPATPSAAPQALGAEPPEGYEARWSAVARDALGQCQADPEVETFAQAVTCALNAAFPESAPWTDPAVASNWAPWMSAAAELVQADLLRMASTNGQPPASWEVELWLRGLAELEVCRDAGLLPAQAATCAAQRIFPGANWHTPAAWQRDLVQALVQMQESSG